ncbi:LysR family transcriptional regulator [Streptomyces sp. NPDC006739]|uniref:LysR family transcriptional regulator n=1 Tax=Streptomyces sp. NPDC006739 TaxID=3364763 RepID=UPI0036AC6011
MPDSPLLPADLDLRLVRYFTVVAEQLHFGRAAAVLRLTQPSLSRQIRRLEQQLGARLLDRTSRGTRLTEAGEVFLPQARELLRAASRAAARTRAAAGPDRFTVGYTTNLIVTPAVRDLRHRHPTADIRTRHLAWNEPLAALLDHRVDVAVARLMFPTDGLDVTVLYEEPRVLLVALDHRLAGKESVALDDLAGETLPRFSGGERPACRQGAAEGPLVETVEDKLELVAGGELVSLAPAGFTANLRPDLTAVRVADAEPVQVVLASRPADRNPLLPAFRRSARARLTQG